MAGGQSVCGLSNKTRLSAVFWELRRGMGVEVAYGGALLCNPGLLAVICYFQINGHFSVLVTPQGIAVGNSRYFA